MMSPGVRHQAKPVIKIAGSGSGHLKKPHAHKRERGRRACSEQGPDRNDFGLTSSSAGGAATNQFNKDDEHKKGAGASDEVEAELQRILDAKLDSSMRKQQDAAPATMKESGNN